MISFRNKVLDMNRKKEEKETEKKFIEVRNSKEKL